MAKLEIGVRGLRQAAAELVKTARARQGRLMEHLRAHGPMSVNAAARGVQRNYKNVHGDIGKLIELGLVERLDDGRLRVPYRSIVAELKMAA